jgi:hypothetical protein
MDLNRFCIPTADGESGDSLNHHTATSEDGRVTVYFRDLQERLLEQIYAADVVVGCVAWLTSFPVLRALEPKRGVSIIVQKEDFLRPDHDAPNKEWLRELKSLYHALIPKLTRRDIGGRLSEMRDRSYRSTSEELAREWFIEDPMDPVRCVGVNYGINNRSQPRMHNKFLVFCKYDNVVGVDPYAAWTGSYNISATAERSFEKALLIRDPSLVNAYFLEYVQIACLSEPLNWKSVTVKPEWWRGSESDWDCFDAFAGEY